MSRRSFWQIRAKGLLCDDALRAVTPFKIDSKYERRMLMDERCSMKRELDT